MDTRKMLICELCMRKLSKDKFSKDKEKEICDDCYDEKDCYDEN